ncbi:hypothetical protein BX666DRAFT_2143485 [Dichotomocladium elegans]|nr:hypothetical protein BX666DRAFT_2143485 [Dichotomocladium elegans]
MSNPIADKIDYFSKLQPVAADSLAGYREYHRSLLFQHRMRVERDYGIDYNQGGYSGDLNAWKGSVHDRDPSLWRTFKRRMSGVVPFPAYYDASNVDGVGQGDGVFSEYTSPFKTTRLTRPPPMLGEDDNLPSTEEVAKARHRVAKELQQRQSYFERPFESDSSLCNDHSTEASEPIPAPTLELRTTAVSALGPDEAISDACPEQCKPEDLHRFLCFSLRDVDIDDAGEWRSQHQIHLQYGDIKWTVRRSNYDFLIFDKKIHMSIAIKPNAPYNPTSIPPFPAIVNAVVNQTLVNMKLKEDDNKEEERLRRRAELAQYLRELIRNSKCGFHHDLYEFLELSAMSLTRDMGWKGKEGYLDYRVITPSPTPLVHAMRRTNWTKRWVILRDSYIAFCKDVHSTSPVDIFFFDTSYKLEERKSFRIHDTHLIISNHSRKIEFKIPGKLAEEWHENFRKIQYESPWTYRNRYLSFAPIRKNAKAKWFVDGHEYFEAVAEAILSAKHEIYIEDWWLSPELYLHRPHKTNQEYRIDRLLKRKAERDGVKIYVVIYRTNSIALPIESNYTRVSLQGLHPNIIVLHHANYTTALFWAHHEKILVIDSRLAFIGGIDLCFGRYDTPAHDLTDYLADDEVRHEIFPGQDYSNPRIKDFVKVRQYNMETIDKRYIARMPWHDIHVGMVGQPARDVAKHFVQRWNFIKSSTREREVPYLTPKGEYISQKDEKKFHGSCRVQILRSSAEWSLGIPREHSIYLAYMEHIYKAKHYIYIENQFFITSTQDDDRLIKNKIGQALVTRIKRAHKENKKFRVIVVLPLAPGFEGDFARAELVSPLRSVAHYQYISICRSYHSVLSQIKEANIPPEKYIGFYSLRNWGRIKAPPPSCSSPTPSGIKEDSPIDSMATIIGTESQSSSSKNFKSSNGAALLTRSNSGKQGWKRTRNRAENNPGGPEEALRRTRLASTRSRDNEYADRRMDYVTEQIYIHSKLMIVDDSIVLCGSANLNDRSQLGNRDSEIATVIEDTDNVVSQLNGAPYLAGKFAYTLRMQLFREHLGMGDGQIQKKGGEEWNDNGLTMDILDDDFYFRVWKDTAEQNTKIYRSIFHCVPDDTIHTFEAHRQFIPDRAHPGHVAEPNKWPEDRLRGELSKIRGHLVTFPLEYLCNENLVTGSVQDAVVRPIIFT